ncbi:hypothetical protein ACSVDA_22845, partial [Cytobacillus sp. Hm23]
KMRLMREALQNLRVVLNKSKYLDDRWRAVYIERCTYGSEGSVWKPIVEIRQGAGRLPYY